MLYCLPKCITLFRRKKKKSALHFKKLLGSAPVGAQKLPLQKTPLIRIEGRDSWQPKIVSSFLLFLMYWLYFTAPFPDVVRIVFWQTGFIWAPPKLSGTCLSSAAACILGCEARLVPLFHPLPLGLSLHPGQPCQSNRRLAKVASKPRYERKPWGDVYERNKKSDVEWEAVKRVRFDFEMLV